MKNIMKSLLLTATLVFGASAFAEGTSYLYWMLTETPKDTPAAWDYAMVKVLGASDDESTKSTIYLAAYDSGVTKFGKESDGTYDYISSTLATIGSDYLNSSYKFIVELYSSGSDPLAYSSAIMGNNIIAGTSPMVIGGNEFGSVHVPEPTSGLLALLGFGLLALRRKRI